MIAASLLTRDLLPLMFFSPVGSTLVLLVAVLVLGIGHAWRAWPAWVRETHLRQGLCPACGYGLAGHAPEPDGCVVCPECASAWNVADEQVIDRAVVVVRAEREQAAQHSENSEPPMKTRETSDELNS